MTTKKRSDGLDKDLATAEEAETLIDSREAQSSPGNRLRTRIMATGYQYKLLDNESQMILDEDNEKARQNYSRTLFLVFIIFLLFLAVMGLVIVLLVVKGHGHETSSKLGNFVKEGLCTSPNCIKTSADILKGMDLEAKLCSDMYQYACGGWLKDNSLPPGYGKWSKFSELNIKNGQFLRKILDDNSTMFKNQHSTAVEKFKSFYRSCMDTDTIEKKGTTGVKQLIKKFGSWTVTPDIGNTTWKEAQWDFQKSLVATHLNGAASFFGFGLGVDAKDSNSTVILFSQSGLTLSATQEYTSNKSQEFKGAFLSFAVKLGVLLGGVEEDVRIKMEKVYNLEKELSQIFVPVENLTDPYETYNKMSLKEFQDLLGPFVRIKDYLSSCFGNRTFQSSDKVIVSTPKYFEKLGSILQNTEKEVLANYMMWMLVQPLATFLPKAFLEASLPLTQAENGVAALPERWQICFALSTKAVGFAASALFVEKKFNPASKQEVISALHKVTDKFIKNLDLLSWLDDATRARLEEKARAVSYKVGYPDWILDPQALDEYYQKLIINESEFLENKLQLTEFATNYVLNKYGKPPDKTEWTIFPHTVNAFYDVENNQVIVPAGILQPPFYSPNFPKPFLYSTVGMIVGHELTHGFDNHGRMFDKFGNLGDQWTKATSNEFKKKADCMIHQYGNYTILGHHLNGRLTLNENIADNGGLLFAYEAFKDDQKEDDFQLPGLSLTDDQMFFLGFSQLWCSLSTDNYKLNSIDTASHSLGEIRVKGVLSNYPQFAAAFNCSEGSPLAPQEKCHVW